ncbi:MAG: hydrolase [Erysipelotrichaceae bacterium]
MHIPEIQGTLRKNKIETPPAIRACSGIRIFGKRIKSVLFSTDVAIIKNSNADAIIAVYPFTPQPVISQAIIMASDAPVFCGVGGGTTNGKRVANLAMNAEFQGAACVVVNAPITNETLLRVKERIDIPIIVTVVSEKTDYAARIAAGASIFNVSGGAQTVAIVKAIREQYPEFPIIATGGPSEASIQATIEAGANCISFTPPTSADIFKSMMNDYRDSEDII